MALNPLNIKTKGETGLAIAILHSSSFRKGRRSTQAGRKLYNKELDMVRKKAKQFGITLHKKLPAKMKV